MTEPEAWEPTELERELLDAAKSDRVPAELGLRMASALSASTLAPAAASAATPSGVLFSKAGLWGALSIAVLSGTGALYMAGSSPRAEALSRAAPLAAPLAAPPAAAPSAPPLAAPVSVPAAVPAPPIAPAAPARQAHGDRAAAGARATVPSALRAEIILLDRARSALDGGDPQRASALLDQHRRRFAAGTLLPEAEALRIEVLVRLGDGARAERLAQRFIAAHPAHPLSERLVKTAPTTAPAPDQP